MCLRPVEQRTIDDFCALLTLAEQHAVSITATPDCASQGRGGCDALIDRGGVVCAVEHTSLDSFHGQRHDDAAFGQVILPVEEARKDAVARAAIRFSSKEAFAQEVLDRYFSAVSSKIENTLRNDSLPPLHRLRAWLDAQIDFLKQSEFRSGCLIGNFTMEASSQSGSIRRRLAAIIQNIEESLAYCLKAAVDAGELSASTDVGEVASFVYSSWQGAILQAKVEQRAEPLERFKNVLFSQLLR